MSSQVSSPNPCSQPLLFKDLDSRKVVADFSGGHLSSDGDKVAETIRTRFLTQVNEHRSPRTRATMNQLFDRWLEVLDVEVSTRRGYVLRLDKHIRPLVGTTPAGRIGVEDLGAFYATKTPLRSVCFLPESLPPS
jgi:hypothetical protein